jgi:ABC-2 type transport system permease protein
MRKEWEEIKNTLFSYHTLQAGIWPLIIFCIAFGVYEPLRLGPDWLQSPIMMFSISVLIPFITIGFISPYSFVGERMRGTLEPLLATPVSDQAILFGKIGIAVVYGWAVTLVNLLLGVGFINLFFTNGKYLLYLPGIVIPTLLLSLLFSILVATIGTNSSFYAKTILEAQRNLVMTLFIPLMLPAFLLGPFMPGGWKGIIVEIIAHLGANNLFLILIVLLFMVDCIFMVFALTRFHRKLLLLE